jgi:hypothetical protein
MPRDIFGSKRTTRCPLPSVNGKEGIRRATSNWETEPMNSSSTPTTSSNETQRVAPALVDVREKASPVVVEVEDGGGILLLWSVETEEH